MSLEKELYEIVKLHFGPNGSNYAHDLMEADPDIYRRILKYGLNALPIEDDEIFRGRSDEDIIKYFVPKKLKDQMIYVGHSSGTTGQRVSVPWLETTLEIAVDWFRENFNLYKIPRNRDILAYGPSGLFEEYIKRLATKMGCNAIVETNEDFGELKRCFDDPKKRDETAREIIEGTILPNLLSNKNIGVLVNLAPVFDILDIGLIRNVDTIIIGGFGTTHSEYWRLKRKYRHKIFLECYGNIFWSWAFGCDDEGYRDFYPPPFLRFEVVEPYTSRKLNYYDYGQVVFTRCTPELLIRLRERDAAMLIPPRKTFRVNGVRDVKPLSEII